jgi:hypothetical protein
MLVVDDEHPASDRLAGAELRPGGEVPFQISDQAFPGRAAGRLDLHKTARRTAIAADEEIRRHGAAEFLIKVDRAHSRSGQHLRDGVDELAAGPIEQPVPYRLSLGLGRAKLLVQALLLRGVVRL